MAVLRALKAFFSVVIKLIVVIVLMVGIAFTSYEGVMYYLTGSFHDIRESQKVANSQGYNTSGTTQAEPTELNHEDSIVSLVFFEDADYDYFDIRMHILDKNTGALDLILLPSNAKMLITGKMKKTLSEKINVADNQACFQDIARCFPVEKYDYISEIIQDATGMNIKGYDIIDKKGMQNLFSLVEELGIQLKHDLTYRNSEHELQVITAGDEGVDTSWLVPYMRYLDGTGEEITNRLDNNRELMQRYLINLLNKTSAKEAYVKMKGQSTYKGEEDTAEDKKELKSALKNVTSDSVSVRVLQGSEDNGVYTIDSTKAQLQISGLLKQAANYSPNGNNAVAVDTDGNVVTASSQIELYNAGYVSGLAAAWKEYLEKHGYTVTKIDNYKEGTLANTEIVVTQEGMGEDLKKYFPNAQITVEDIPSGAAMIIYLGKDSAYIIPGHESSRPEGVVLDEEEASTETTEEINIIPDDEEETSEDTESTEEEDSQDEDEDEDFNIAED